MVLVVLPSLWAGLCMVLFIVKGIRMTKYILSYSTGDYDSLVNHIFVVEYSTKSALQMDLHVATINRRHADIMREETSDKIIEYRKLMRKNFFRNLRCSHAELDELNEEVCRWTMKSFTLEFGGYCIPSDTRLTPNDIEIYEIEEFLEKFEAERKVL